MNTFLQTIATQSALQSEKKSYLSHIKNKISHLNPSTHFVIECTRIQHCLQHDRNKQTDAITGNDNTIFVDARVNSESP